MFSIRHNSATKIKFSIQFATNRSILNVILPFDCFINENADAFSFIKSSNICFFFFIRENVTVTANRETYISNDKADVGFDVEADKDTAIGNYYRFFSSL